MLFKIVCLFCYFSQAFVAGFQTKNWEYALLSADSKSSNEELFKIDIQIDRISRGVYGISGLVYITVDTDKEYIEATSYRSASGSNNYKILPYKIQNQTFQSFMNTFYKSLLMPSLNECSNAPQCGKYEQPVVDKSVEYKFDKCQISTDSFPSHLMPGFYKIIAIFTGMVDINLEILVEVTPKEMI